MTLYTLEWLQSPELRRRVQVGLNKGEAKHALARAVFKKKQTIQRPLLHNKKEIADYAISFSMTRTGFEPVLPP